MKPILTLLSLFVVTAAFAAPPADQPKGDATTRILPLFGIEYTPAFPDTLSIVYLANARPVVVKATIRVDGQSLSEMWHAHLRKLFAAFDRDKNGFLNAAEVENIFSPNGIAGLLRGTYYHGAGDSGKSLKELDRDADGKVSFTEFAASYDEASQDLIGLRSIPFDDTADRDLTRELFAKLDRNGDKKLTKDELSGAEKLLYSWDADENESLSTDEIRRNRTTAAPMPTAMSTSTTAQPPALKQDHNLQVFRGAMPERLLKQFLTKYDTNNDQLFSNKELGLDESVFAKLDTNRDGQLSQDELKGLSETEPDFVAAIEIAHDFQKRKVTITPSRPLPKSWELREGEAGRVVLRMENQLLDLSTASPPPGSVARRVTDQLNSIYPSDKKEVSYEDISGPQYQFLRIVFDSADRNADEKLTRDEFKAYLQLQEDTINLALSCSFATRRPSLFQLMDDNGDNQLGIRELRTAFQRLIVLEPTGGDTLTEAALQPSASVRFGFTAFLANDFTRPINPFARPGARKVSGPLWFRKMDRNGDNDVSRSEFVGPLEKFLELDADKDGLISVSEAIAADKKLRDKK